MYFTVFEITSTSEPKTMCLQKADGCIGWGKLLQVQSPYCTWKMNKSSSLSLSPFTQTVTLITPTTWRRVTKSLQQLQSKIPELCARMYLICTQMTLLFFVFLIPLHYGPIEIDILKNYA